ncbi:hypothetical protein G4V62_17290 [Bacillaceae bacterium SIJ1]|uniref:hypothetical protein n=1 Tax=Litoribacterium kuwaitense TaxID=1398745 RepID=UPI0013EE0984|nr:hypothetical protein [Litoribacterium kuwaitense]NGP46612.1 hypothetical protein [Litoribacterium kuwaitense]
MSNNRIPGEQTYLVLTNADSNMEIGKSENTERVTTIKFPTKRAIESQPNLIPK